jgi:hypothetical protein
MEDFQLVISEPTVPRNIVFFDNNQKEVGRIDWTDGIIKFDGDVDESAKIFFEFLLRETAEKLKKENIKLKEKIRELDWVKKIIEAGETY